MKIIHICLEGPYTDYWSYQENILPKYHRKSGHDVTIIATTKSFNIEGNIVDVGKGNYYLKDGQHIIRVDYFHNIISNRFSFFKKYYISDILEKMQPDLIMLHGIGNTSARQIADYCNNHSKCVVVADNHIYEEMFDFKKGFLSAIRNYIIKTLNKDMQTYYKKIYGITPSCVDTAIKYWGIDKEKIELLPLGCDDELIDFEKKHTIRNNVRKKYEIEGKTFLIVSGGKLDKNKNIEMLLKAFTNSHFTKTVTLVLFGNFVNQEYEKIIRGYVDDKKIKYIGFLDVPAIYDLYIGSDLAFFPGTQSALWIQSIACGLPGVFRYWNKMDYLDLGGNCKFIYEDSTSRYKDLLEQIIENEKVYESMKEAAMHKGRAFFSYQNQAKNITKMHGDFYK